VTVCGGIGLIAIIAFVILVIKRKNRGYSTL